MVAKNEIIIRQKISKNHFQVTKIYFGRKYKNSYDILDLDNMHGGFIQYVVTDDWYFRYGKLRKIISEDGINIDFIYKKVLIKKIQLKYDNIILEQYLYTYTFY